MRKIMLMVLAGLLVVQPVKAATYLYFNNSFRPAQAITPERIKVAGECIYAQHSGIGSTFAELNISAPDYTWNISSTNFHHDYIYNTYSEYDSWLGAWDFNDEKWMYCSFVPSGQCAIMDVCSNEDNMVLFDLNPNKAMTLWLDDTYAWWHIQGGNTIYATQLSGITTNGSVISSSKSCQAVPTGEYWDWWTFVDDEDYLYVIWGNRTTSGGGGGIRKLDKTDCSESQMITVDSSHLLRFHWQEKPVNGKMLVIWDDIGYEPQIVSLYNTSDLNLLWEIADPNVQATKGQSLDYENVYLKNSIYGSFGIGVAVSECNLINGADYIVDIETGNVDSITLQSPTYSIPFPIHTWDKQSCTYPPTTTTTTTTTSTTIAPFCDIKQVDRRLSIGGTVVALSCGFANIVMGMPILFVFGMFGAIIFGYWKKYRK